MVELGKYTTTVLSSYGVSLLLLIALVWMSVRRGRKVRLELGELEARRQKNG
ncbi:heme exporter protein CcmD [Epibacterium sp. SM1969]|uniref:Heme exporter protein D n=1 Tax=Tritonibacter aquimaris TaxID=2663379 RepID=A0A844B2J1_9RHOB|nr:heme exporter protein CcmD [Tritonibacter aquimaris]MQY44301.1 heme exporter protein CcmD [Tritonibacter aquimaris]